MTKATRTKLQKKGIVGPVPKVPNLEKRNFTPEECLQLQQMNQMCNTEKFKTAMVKGNTSLVPRGKEVAEELEAVVRLCENAKNAWLIDTFLDCGYPADTLCNVNLATGEITVLDREEKK